ncbi:unnamed protein product [Moneuplotes crassus]|uniref:Uncharacterized protein n=1 Tax=Euplotes crassus TaxID=5936 RepID=A0AAD1U4N7_EUPCR|nr:unnamed protein product [Moneuplotes crassus]
MSYFPMLNKKLSPKGVLSAAGEFMTVKPGISSTDEYLLNPKQKYPSNFKGLKSLQRSLTKENKNLTPLKNRKASGNTRKRNLQKKGLPQPKFSNIAKNFKLKSQGNTLGSNFCKNQLKSSIETSLSDLNITISMNKQKRSRNMCKISKKINNTTMDICQTKRRESALKLPSTSPKDEDEEEHSSQLNIETNYGNQNASENISIPNKLKFSRSKGKKIFKTLQKSILKDKKAKLKPNKRIDKKIKINAYGCKIHYGSQILTKRQDMINPAPRHNIRKISMKASLKPIALTGKSNISRNFPSHKLHGVLEKTYGLHFDNLQYPICYDDCETADQGLNRLTLCISKKKR